jgi:hypothetical protein
MGSGCRPDDACRWFKGQLLAYYETQNTGNGDLQSGFGSPNTADFANRWLWPAVY